MEHPLYQETIINVFVNPNSRILVGHAMLPIRTILYPAGYSEHSEYAFTGYSEHSEYAFQAACELTRDYGARLIVLHVLHAAESPRPRGDGRLGGSSWSGNDRDSPKRSCTGSSRRIPPSAWNTG